MAFFSSGEARELLHALAYAVTRDFAESHIWDREFQQGRNFLEDLLEIVGRVDFVVVLATPDDQIRRRGKSFMVPRDNVIFELGVALSRLAPERVVVVRPEGLELGIPSDYGSRTNVFYSVQDQSDPERQVQQAAAGIRAHYQRLWRNRTPAVPTAAQRGQTGQRAELVDLNALGTIMPVYRELRSTSDWYAEFESLVTLPRPALRSRMLYTGPGLATNWFSASGSSANSAQSTAFEDVISPLLDQFVPPESKPKGRTIIDLGVGDFAKGTSIIRRLLAREPSGCIKYIALDASYEMLTTALGKATVLNELLERDGQVIGINALFDDLAGFSHLFAEPGRNVFLLLGNTLGNELDEQVVLNAIGRAMKENDILITEVQLQEDRPIPLAAMTDTANESRDFFAGPFVSLGYKPEHVRIEVRRDERVKPAKGNRIWSYDYLCHLGQEQNVRILGRKKPVRLREGEVLVYLVRKYSLDALDEEFREAGLTIVKRMASAPIGEFGRRFGHLVAVKKRGR